jgi:hypothetical protein
MCGSCGANSYGADFMGSLKYGYYTLNELLKEFENSLNKNTKAVTGKDNEWTITIGNDPAKYDELNKVIFHSNIGRTWTFKSLGGSVYDSKTGALKVSGVIDNYWIWGGHGVAPYTASYTTIPAIKNTITIDSTNNTYQLALCGSCQPNTSYGGDINGSINFGTYTLPQLITELQNSVNFYTKRTTGVDNEFSITLGTDPTNYATYNVITMTNNGKRAFTFKSVGNSFYTNKATDTNKLLLSGLDNFWSWTTGVFNQLIL